MTGFYTEYEDTSGVHVGSAEEAAAEALASKNAAAASATAAAASEVLAGNHETAASTSETNATTSATNAATSATNAATSATTASTKADEAALSASNTATSETAAATSATNAATSATNSASSATAAATAETNAETAETNAETAETNAASSATASASSASTASTQATNASNSASAAATSETNAGNSATAAATSATNAASSQTAAASSASTASSSATTATTKAGEAATSATNSATSATNSSNSATSAGTAQTAAEAARDAALAAFDSFDDRYLGQKSSDPTVDNDGNALVAGTLYFNTTDEVMKVYEGSAWVAAYASLSGALLSANNLSDLNSAGAARTNLGLGTAATTAATAYATAAQGTKVDGIEAGATADQTGAEIKTAYEAETNAFTDAQFTKLDGIEPNADVTDTANVTAAGALMDSELTSIASVKALDQGVATGDSPAFAGLTVDTTTLAVDSTNNRVGINTGSPAHALVVSDTYAPTLEINNSDVTIFTGETIGEIRFTGDDGGVSTVGASISAIALQNWEAGNQPSNLLFKTNSGAANTERMRISSTGGVGIGTSSPSSPLTVSGEAKLGLIANPVRINSSATTGIVEFSSTGSGVLRTLGSVPLTLQTNSTERTRISPTGSVGIGTTAPAQKLHVVGSIVATGNITAYYSDERLKDFKGKIDNPLEKLNTLNGYYFKPNETALIAGAEQNGLEVGVSAQEVEKVLPEIVSPSALGKGYKTVSYEKLTPLLIEAVKELSAKVDDLELRLQNLEK